MTVASTRRDLYDDARQTRFTTSVDEALRRFTAPFLQGVSIRLPERTTFGAFRVAHKLGRVPVGYIITDLVLTSGTVTPTHIIRRDDDERSKTGLGLYSTAGWRSLELWVF